ncbi:unnamed protein product [Ectocarpus sp. 13 AM-2016]
MRLDVWTAAVAFYVLPQETLSEFAVAGLCQEGSLDARVFRVRPPCPSSSICRGNSNGDVAATAMDRDIAKQHEAGPPRTSSEATQSKHKAPAAAAAAAAAATTGRAGEAEAARAAEATAVGTPMAEGATRFERGGAALTESRGGGRGMPSVTLKLAMDRNGAVDDMSEGPKRFTSQASLDAVHRIRRDCEAVLVGVGTVVRDDPSLTVRRVPLNEGQTRQPTRVVLDRTLRLTGAQAGQNPRAILGDGHSSLVFYSAGCEDTEARAAELKAGVKRSRATVSDSSGETEPGTSHQRLSPVDFVGLPVQRPGAGVDLSGVLEALFEGWVRAPWLHQVGRRRSGVLDSTGAWLARGGGWHLALIFLVAEVCCEAVVRIVLLLALVFSVFPLARMHERAPIRGGGSVELCKGGMKTLKHHQQEGCRPRKIE